MKPYSTEHIYHARSRACNYFHLWATLILYLSLAGQIQAKCANSRPKNGPSRAGCGTRAACFPLLCQRLTLPNLCFQTGGQTSSIVTYNLSVKLIRLHLHNDEVALLSLSFLSLYGTEIMFYIKPEVTQDWIHFEIKSDAFLVECIQAYKEKDKTIDRLKKSFFEETLNPKQSHKKY